MIKYTYHVLEFQRLMHIISGWVSIPIKHLGCLALEPEVEQKIIKDQHKLFSEMKRLLNMKEFFIKWTHINLQKKR